MPRHELLNQFIGQIKPADYAIDELISRNFIYKIPNSKRLELTADGADIFESEKEYRNEKAQQTADQNAKQRAQTSQVEKNQKKQFRHDFFVAAFSAIVGVLLTLLVEHSPEIFNAILSFFH